MKTLSMHHSKNGLRPTSATVRQAFRAERDRRRVRSFAAGAFGWIVSLALCFITLGSALGAPYPKEGLLTEWVQPDETRLILRVFGDEFYARTATDDGYTVIFSPADKTYYYAEIGTDGRSLVSSRVMAHQAPSQGLVKHLKEPKETIAAIRAANIQKYAPDRAAKWDARKRAAKRQRARTAGIAPADDAGELAPTAADLVAAAPYSGSVVGLMILVQFPDDPATAAFDPVNFPTTRAKMIRYSNAVGYTDDGNTGSIRDYFYDQSNGQLTHTQLVTPIVTLSQPRDYYNWSDYPVNSTHRDNGAAGRLLVNEAITQLKAAGFDFSTLSVDSANQVYATSLLFAGSDSGVWAEGLWPHAWYIFPQINVGTAASPRYIFGYQITNLSNAAPVIGTVCHELGHLLLDYPDLYDYGGDSEGVGEHSLMGSGNHLNGGKTPAPIDLYLKGFSGWSNITDLIPGDSLQAALPSTGNYGYRIRKPGISTEYFLVENRGDGDKWADYCRDKGIAIWHADETFSGNDNQQMTAAQHYELSLEQADGLFDLENNRNRGDSTDLFDATSSFLNDSTNPDADWWDGVASGVSIEVLSAPGSSMVVRFAPDVIRVSTNSADAQSNAGSVLQASSGDGRYVGFQSDASNLVSGDTNGVADIFVKDAQTGVTRRVSITSTGAQGNAGSIRPAISADGRYAVFESLASNLVAGDSNGRRDIFVNDAETGITRRVSTTSTGAQGNGNSNRPAMSADGRYVVFESTASNLVAGDTNGVADILVKDAQAGATSRVSTNSAGAQGNGGSIRPAISADGRYVAFQSDASNLVAGDTNGLADVFVKDAETSVTRRVSTDSAGVQANGPSTLPTISADGRYSVFESTATNLVSGDTNGVADIFVKDVQTGATRRVSTTSAGAQGNGNSSRPTISDDGRYIVFESTAGNLVSGDTNGVADIFVKDAQTGVISRVSTGSAGVQANGPSTLAAISADGHYVVFSSEASNLAAGDTNGVSDALRTGNPSYVPDSDGDWLRNDLEAALGTNLNSADTDSDGLSDYDEVNWDLDPTAYTAGNDTNPNNPDTDGDGFTDGTEAAAGTDPLDDRSQPAVADGDLNLDGVVNAADIVIGQQALMGAIALTPTQLMHGDVAPWDNGPTSDGQFTLGDLLVIQRMVFGHINTQP